MDIDESPVIGIAASSLTILIEEREKALRTLKVCDAEWREERDRWRSRTVELRRGLLDALELPLSEDRSDEGLIEAVRNALAVATVHTPKGPFVLDHDSAAHLVKTVTELPSVGSIVNEQTARKLRYGKWCAADGAVSTEPWQSGDIIRYADEDGPIVDAELVMRERDERDTVWAAKVVTAHRPYVDGVPASEWQVGDTIYPIEQDARFTKLADPLGRHAEPTPAAVLNPNIQLDQQPTALAADAEQDNGPDTQAMEPIDETADEQVADHD